MRILAISGSLRRDSHNSALLRAAATLLPPGVDLLLYDGLREIPPYDDDHLLLPVPAAVGRLRDETDGADAVLIATPEYNRSIPGALKNAIDWASRPYGTNAFASKPSAVIGASPGKIGTAVGQQHLRSIMAFCNSPQMNSVEAYIQFEPGLVTADGSVTNPKTEEFLRKYMTEFLGFIQRVTTVLPRKA